MMIDGNFMANIHLLKTFLSKYFKTEFNKIKFVSLSKINNRRLVDKFDCNDEVIYVEEFVSVNMNNAFQKLTLFDDFNSTIVDDNDTYYGETINDYIVRKNVDVNNNTFLMIVKHCKDRIDSIEIVKTESLKTFLKKEITALEFILLAHDRNIANLNQLYFGSIKDIPTLN